MKLIDCLELRKLLDGTRGCPLLRTRSAFADPVNEIDVNPIIVLPGGCGAVDGLVIAEP